MDYLVGDVVEYVTVHGARRVVKVTSKSPNVRCGREGFDGVVLDSTEQDHRRSRVWGYSTQVVRVMKESEWASPTRKQAA